MVNIASIAVRIRLAIASITVRVRLPKLPIEYYDPEAIKEIGQAIGNVLHINTHTALESSGHYAQLCV